MLKPKIIIYAKTCLHKNLDYYFWKEKRIISDLLIILTTKNDDFRNLYKIFHNQDLINKRDRKIWNTTRYSGYSNKYCKIFYLRTFGKIIVPRYIFYSQIHENVMLVQTNICIFVHHITYYTTYVNNIFQAALTVSATLALISSPYFSITHHHI